MPAIFLSASFPDPERASSFPESDPAALADAVTAISRALLRRDVTLVCGGHPTITPLLLFLAAEHGAKRRVLVYQSEHFRTEIPEQTWRLEREGWGVLRFTPARGDRSIDLEVMRKAMLDAEPLRAAIFIGGMSGIRDEYELVGARYPGVPRIPLVATGGATAELRPDASVADLDVSSRRYPALALQIVRRLGL